MRLAIHHAQSLRVASPLHLVAGYRLSPNNSGSITFLAQVSCAGGSGPIMNSASATASGAGRAFTGNSPTTATITAVTGCLPNTYTLNKTVGDAGAGPCTAPTAPTAIPAVTYSHTLTVATGHCVAIHIAITNNSALPVTSLTLSDALPAGLTGVFGAGNTGCFEIGNPPCAVTAGGATFTSGAGYTLASGATGTITFLATANCSFATNPFTNSATATANNGTALTQDPASLPSASITVTGCPPPAPSTYTLVKTVADNGAGPCTAPTAPSALPAGPFSHTLTVAAGHCVAIFIEITNNSASPITSLTLSDVLPPGLTGVSGAGNTGCYEVGNPPCAVTAGGATFTSGAGYSLAPGARDISPSWQPPTARSPPTRLPTRQRRRRTTARPSRRIRPASQVPASRSPGAPRRGRIPSRCSRR